MNITQEETDRRRERLALTLEALAAATRNATTGHEFDYILESIHDMARDTGGYYNRTLRAMFALEDAAADN